MTDTDTDMATAWLQQLYEPRSVAVVGASDDIRLPGGRLLQFLLNYGFTDVKRSVPVTVN